MKTPKKYREYTQEELMKEYDEMREEFAGLSKNPDSDGEELLQFLEKNQDLINAVGVRERQYLEERLSKK